MTDIAFVALGSNLGDRDAYLAFARRAIDALPGVRLIAESAIEETAPMGDVPQGPYLNQMLAIETTVSPERLLEALQGIENDAGRTREVRWGPRTLDCDIVEFGTAVRDSATLTLPHPGLAARDFWRRERAAVLRQLRVTTERGAFDPSAPSAPGHAGHTP